MAGWVIGSVEIRPYRDPFQNFLNVAQGSCEPFPALHGRALSVDELTRS